MLTQNALPEDILDRFLIDTRAIVRVARTDRIGIAVSGGPDSLALLLLAQATFTGQVYAATVDHGLRPEAADEAASVARICADLGVPHRTLAPPRPLARPQARNSVMARARELRYALLDDWCTAASIDWMMTAHHADDQMETLIMRLNRGSGVGGLASIRRRNRKVVRPLLGWRREALLEIVRAAGLRPVDDPSNRDDRYDRARLRKALAEIDWIDPVALARSAANLEDAEAAIVWACGTIATQRLRVIDGQAVLIAPSELPREIVRRLAGAAIRSINADARLDGPKFSRLIDIVSGGGKATLDGVLCDGAGPNWTLCAAPPRQSVR